MTWDHTIRVRVSFTDDDGYPETLTSDATGPVVRPPNASPGGRPAVSGVLAVGKTLTADTSGITDPNGLSNPAFTHQWARSIGSTDTDILGATGSSYTIASSDAGNAFKVTVAFTDDEGYAATLTSGLTQTVMTEPEPKPGERTGRAVPRDAVTLVSNTGQTTGSTSYFIGLSGSNQWSYAIKFTTGSATNGYTITEASVKLSQSFSNAIPKVSIYTSTSDLPARSSSRSPTPVRLSSASTHSRRRRTRRSRDRPTTSWSSKAGEPTFRPAIAFRRPNQRPMMRALPPAGVWAIAGFPGAPTVAPGRTRERVPSPRSPSKVRNSRDSPRPPAPRTCGPPAWPTRA